MIMAAHGIPYVATASISYPEDFMNKVKKACEIDGPAFIQILQPCTTGWGYPASKTVELGRLAVKAGIWPLYEIENGEYRVTYKPSKRISIEEYLKTQKRYRHLTEEDIEEMQNLINHKCQEMGI
jgi:pyruvate ferredoxin oxidoreductase beta subunit